MSKWKLVPVEWPDTPCPYGSPAHYAQMVAAAPEPPPEVLEAMVERGARALWVESDAMPWAAHKDTITGRSYRAIARASILAALEIEG